MAAERLQELADLCEARPLTDDELNEAYGLSVGGEVVPSFEQWLAEQEESD